MFSSSSSSRDWDGINFREKHGPDSDTKEEAISEDLPGGAISSFAILATMRQLGAISGDTAVGAISSRANRRP